MNVNLSWLSTTVTRSTSVVPVYGFGMGDVRPQTIRPQFTNRAAGTSAMKRHADAVKATLWDPQPWSPPVT